MRTATACFLGAIAVSGAALAEEAMTPEAFRAMVEGRTVHYTYGGQYYGSERFYTKDRATWQNPSGSCEHGHWWEVGDELCFQYGTSSCWKVFVPEEGAGYAVSRSGLRVEIESIDRIPLRCEGDPVA